MNNFSVRNHVHSSELFDLDIKLVKSELSKNLKKIIERAIDICYDYLKKENINYVNQKNKSYDLFYIRRSSNYFTEIKVYKTDKKNFATFNVFDENDNIVPFDVINPKVCKKLNCVPLNIEYGFVNYRYGSSRLMSWIEFIDLLIFRIKKKYISWDELIETHKEMFGHCDYAPKYRQDANTGLFLISGTYKEHALDLVCIINAFIKNGYTIQRCINYID